MASGQFGLGVLRVRVALDSPGRIHYGNEAAVTGNVILRFTPKVKSHKVELFGPLAIEVAFLGKLHADYLKHYAPVDIRLFQKTAKIHDGPFRADPDTDYNMPFCMTFPQSANPRENIALTFSQGPHGSLRSERHVTDTAVEDLPPTLSSELYKNDSRLMGPAYSSPFHMDVRYSISACVQMPGIDVVIVHPSEDTTVAYDLPRIPLSMAATLDMKQYVEMRVNAQDESLIPEDSRPQGFKSKAKAFLTPAIPPKFSFDLGISGVPLHVFVGQQIAFSLYASLRPQDNPNAAIPKIRLTSCAVSLIAHTTGREKGATKNSVNLEVLMKRQATFVPGILSHGRENGQSVTAGNLGHVPSSFTHAGIGRSYTLRIAIQVTVAEQVINMKRDFKVNVHPPCLLAGDSSVVADLSSLAWENTANDEQLPGYEEAVAAHRNAQEVQPSYEEAMGDCNTSGLVSSSGRAPSLRATTLPP